MTLHTPLHNLLFTNRYHAPHLTPRQSSPFHPFLLTLPLEAQIPKTHPSPTQRNSLGTQPLADTFPAATNTKASLVVRLATAPEDKHLFRNGSRNGSGSGRQSPASVSLTVGRSLSMLATLPMLTELCSQAQALMYGIQLHMSLTTVNSRIGRRLRSDN